MLLDIEGIAPCLPGAQLQEVEGDEYRGIVKVKVGPITAQYKGTAKLAEVDEASRRIVIDASGRDTRGQGNAKATIVVTMNDDDGGTKVDVVTDLSITGKVAQFGRGVLADVSSKLMGQFVENLERDVLDDAGGGDRRTRAARTTGLEGAATARGRIRQRPRRPAEPRRPARVAGRADHQAARARSAIGPRRPGRPSWRRLRRRPASGACVRLRPAGGFLRGRGRAPV